MPPENSLLIEFQGHSVGQLELNRDTDALSLHYDNEWLKNGFALSPYLPLQGRHQIAALSRFLRNLFPEGNSFERLLDTYRISKNNTFGLIRLLGNDTASGLVFRLPGQAIEPPEFRLLSDDELIGRLRKRHSQGLAVWDEKLRLSVAGVQDKINVLLNADGQLGFGEGLLCSTHILKFEQQHQSHMVLNEYVMMTLAKKIGLSVAETSLRRFGEYPALLVRRFDRQWEGTQQVQRHYVIDGCQALNLPPEYKYERNFGSGRDVKHIREGASLPRLFALCQSATQPAIETGKLLDQVLFNLCIHNHDAHGKNFSFFADQQGMRLTPAYDLINIAMYPEFDQEMAMALGDEFDSRTVHAYQLADFADSCQLPRALVVRRLRRMTKALLKTTETAEFNTILIDDEEYRFTKSLLNTIQVSCRHLLTETDGLMKMTL